jgi:hypothetical protein
MKQRGQQFPSRQVSGRPKNNEQVWLDRLLCHHRSSPIETMIDAAPRQEMPLKSFVPTT